MSGLLLISLDFMAGSLIGALFYGGLWWTVRRVRAGVAGLWLVGSFLVRATIALAGLYAVARGGGYAPAACFAGFLAGRIAVTHVTRLPPTPRPPATARSGMDGSRAEP